MATSPTSQLRRGHRGAEPDERRVVGVALRDSGGPALPVAVERRQLVHGVEPVVAGQDLGTPRRIPAACGEERHLGLTGRELSVESRQVGDLECDDQEADAGRQDLERPGTGPAVAGDAEREDRRARDAERRRVVRAAVPPDDEREAQQDQAQPEDEEQHHGRRAHEGEHPVADLVVGEPGREPVRRATERTGPGRA